MIPTIGEQVDALEMAIEALEERPHGEWKPCGNPDKLGIHTWHECSNCGNKIPWFNVMEFDFCPKCGSNNRKEVSE